MLQDPEGLMSEGQQRQRERLVRAEVLRRLDAEGIGVRHSLASVLRRVAERIDPLALEPRLPHKAPDDPRPAS